MKSFLFMSLGTYHNWILNHDMKLIPPSKLHLTSYCVSTWPENMKTKRVSKKAQWIIFSTNLKPIGWNIFLWKNLIQHLNVSAVLTYFWFWFSYYLIFLFFLQGVCKQCMVYKNTLPSWSATNGQRRHQPWKFC